MHQSFVFPSIAANHAATFRDWIQRRRSRPWAVRQQLRGGPARLPAGKRSRRPDASQAAGAPLSAPPAPIRGRELGRLPPRTIARPPRTTKTFWTHQQVARRLRAHWATQITGAAHRSTESCWRWESRALAENRRSTRQLKDRNCNGPFETFTCRVRGCPNARCRRTSSRTESCCAVVPDFLVPDILYSVASVFPGIGFSGPLAPEPRRASLWLRCWRRPSLAAELRPQGITSGPRWRLRRYRRRGHRVGETRRRGAQEMRTIIMAAEPAA